MWHSIRRFCIDNTLCASLNVLSYGLAYRSLLISTQLYVIILIYWLLPHEVTVASMNIFSHTWWLLLISLIAFNKCIVNNWKKQWIKILLLRAPHYKLLWSPAATCSFMSQTITKTQNKSCEILHPNSKPLVTINNTPLYHWSNSNYTHAYFWYHLNLCTWL